MKKTLSHKLMVALTVAGLISPKISVDIGTYILTSHYLDELGKEKNVQVAREKATSILEQNKNIVDYVVYSGCNHAAIHYLAEHRGEK